MTILENSDRRLVVKAGGMLSSSTLTLDKEEGRARLERNLFFWKQKPVEVPLADISDVEVKTVKDAASGAAIPVPIVRTNSGAEMPLPVSDQEAAETVQRVCDFLGIKPH